LFSPERTVKDSESCQGPGCLSQPQALHGQLRTYNFEVKAQKRARQINTFYVGNASTTETLLRIYVNEKKRDGVITIFKELFYTSARNGSVTLGSLFH
jgi:hypothetical protein